MLLFFGIEYRQIIRTKEQADESSRLIGVDYSCLFCAGHLAVTGFQISFEWFRLFVLPNQKMKNKYYVLMSIMMSLISMSFASCSGGGNDGGGSDKGGLGSGEWYVSGLYYTMDQLNQSMYDLFNGDWSNCPANCFDPDGKLNVTYQQPPTYEVSLDGYLKKVTYAPKKLTTDGFKFIQIVNSNTLIIYLSGAIYKADYQYGTKVYELEGNKYTGPLAVFADDPYYLTYTRDGNYLNVTLEGKNEKIAISGNSLIIENSTFNKISTAKSMSTTNIVDNSSPNTNNNGNLSNYSSCPDENHPHMIDLGLPSGTKWACCNIDANAPGQYGNRYAWGETTSKSDFNWSNYKYRYNNIGNDISGTQYDVAHEKWGSSWCMPTKDQFEELLNNTTSEWFVAPGDVIGQKFTGKNGNKIFLPLLHSEATGAFYWTSTNHIIQSSQSYKLYFATDSRKVEINASNHCDGHSIRPVQGNSTGGGGGNNDQGGDDDVAANAKDLNNYLSKPLGYINANPKTADYSTMRSALLVPSIKLSEIKADTYKNLVITTAYNESLKSLSYRGLQFFAFDFSEYYDKEYQYAYGYTFTKHTSDLSDPYPVLDQIVKDFNYLGIPISYSKTPQGYNYAEGVVDVGNLQYFLYLDKYYDMDWIEEWRFGIVVRRFQ